MRISGLASGMDTETMVKELMSAHRLPLEKIEQKKTYMEWQRDDYRAVNQKIFDFRTQTSDSLLRLSTFIKKTASSSSPDDVTVKNINSVSNFSGSISIQSLAEQATMRSNGRVNGSATAINVKEKLSTLDTSLTDSQTITIKAIKQDGTMQTDEEAFSLTFDPSEKSLQDVLDKINSDSNVSALYDSFTGKISITSKYSGNNATGAEIEIEMSDEFKNFTQLDTNNVDAAWTGNGSEGKNAKFTLDGLVTERNSNTFTVNGYELTLKKASNTNITFSSATDTDGILESVTKFVDEYNKLIENLNKEIKEDKYRDFQPLSDEQKEDMTDKQIEQWEEKAKSGTLRNDSTITSALSQMRSILFSEVDGVTGASRLSDIGITTSANYLDNGKLIIDEEKLKKAISDDPNQVYELFAADGETDGEKGVARRLVAAMDETRKNIITKAGSDGSVNNSFTLGRLLDNYKEQISSFEDRLTALEDRYWKQFTAMETAIQKANSQSTYLSNMFTSSY